MTTFTVRVELHNAGQSEYLVLHGSMTMAGFKNTIRSDASVSYVLPPGEYNYVGTATRSEILEAAKKLSLIHISEPTRPY